MWVYYITYKVKIKATPFSLVYEVEAILSIEFEINSFRIEKNDKLIIQEFLKNILEQLESFNEI